MIRILTLVIFMASFTPATGFSAAKIVDQKSFAGKTLQIEEISETEHRVLLDSQLLYTDDHNKFIEVKGVYQSDGHDYALISGQSGGTACPALLRIVEIWKNISVSEEFGPCSDEPEQIMAQAGALVLTLPQMDGQANEVFRYKSGKLTSLVQPIPYRPTGPAVAPNNDIAALVLGKNIDDVVQIRVPALAQLRVMGESYVR